MQFFSADVDSTKNFKFFFAYKHTKKNLSKVANNRLGSFQYVLPISPKAAQKLNSIS